MTTAESPDWRGWGHLFKLVAPLHLTSALEGDLSEDYESIAGEHGQSVAGRWLRRQLRITSVELLWREFTATPWKLMGTAVIASVIYIAVLTKLSRVPLSRFALWNELLLFLALPVLLGVITSAIFRNRELSTAFSAGGSSGGALIGLGLIHSLGLLPNQPSPAVSAAVCWFGWLAGGVAVRLGRIRDHEIRQLNGVRAACQKIMHFEHSTMIAAPVEKVFAFHERPDAIKLLTPWWLFPKIRRVRGRGIEEGVEVEVTAMGLSKWRARHVAFERNRLFVDEMVSGPMKSWRHEHRFSPQENGALLTDSIEFVPFGPAWVVRLGLRMLFAFRHAITKDYCEQA